MQETTLRPVAAALGIATLAFGAVPLLAPRPFARLFGLPAPDVAGISMIRSLGVRDVVSGMGLWSAAAHGGRYAPWLLARLLTDAGDTLSVGAAVAGGLRHPRFLALGALAAGASAAELALYLAARRSSGTSAGERNATERAHVLHV